MSRRKIIVTRRWPSIVETELKKMGDDIQLNEGDHPMSKEELKEALRSAECVLITVTDAIDAGMIRTPDRRCQFLGNFGVGFDHIDLEAAREEGIVVTHTPDVLTDCTADLAMTLILMIARRTGEGERQVRAKAWRGWHPTHMLGTRVVGKTLGLVGLGRIGQALAHRAHFGFGMKIIYCNPSSISPEIIEKYKARSCDSLDDLLEKSDFVSLHCPGRKETYHLIDEKRLTLMKPSAYLINTARGHVVDNQALIRVLQEKRISGAGLDVFEDEPDLNRGFLDLENVVLLPHLGSASRETRIAMGRRVLKNLKAYLADEEPRDRIA